MSLRDFLSEDGEVISVNLAPPVDMLVDPSQGEDLARDLLLDELSIQQLLARPI